MVVIVCCQIVVFHSTPTQHHRTQQFIHFLAKLRALVTFSYLQLEVFDDLLMMLSSVYSLKTKMIPKKAPNAFFLGIFFLLGQKRGIEMSKISSLTFGHNTLEYSDKISNSKDASECTQKIRGKNHRVRRKG